MRLWRLDTMPPGLFFDEAVNGVDVRYVLSGAGMPLYFEANSGREPFFIYLQTILVALTGATPFALRLAGAFSGIAAVAAVYFCAEQLFSNDEPAGARRYLPAIAAAVLAVSYWHLSISRLGLRAGAMIAPSALALGYFARAWRLGRRRDYLWAGVWLGGAQYTYLAARALPLVLVVFAATEVARAVVRSPRRDRTASSAATTATGFLWCGLVAVIVAAPLLLALISSPGGLAGRTADVSLLSGAAGDGLAASAGRIADNLVRQLASFYVTGDGNYRHNLPGRPANDMLVALLFTLGLVAALIHVRRSQARLLLSWFLVMLAPAVLASGAPHALRSVGALPPVALLSALGANWLATFVPRRLGALALPSLLALVVLAGGARTASDYFIRWAQLPGLGAAFDVADQVAAEQTRKLVASGRPVLVPYHLFVRPQMLFALGPGYAAIQEERSAQVSLPAETVLISTPQAEAQSTGVPAYLANGERLVLLQGNRAVWVQPATPDAEAQLLGAVQVVSPDARLRSPVHRSEWPEAIGVPVPEAIPLSPRQIRYPLQVRFANRLTMLGYDVAPAETAPGSSAAYRLTTLWRLDDDSTARSMELTHIFNQLLLDGAVWATANREMAVSYLLPWITAGSTLQETRLLSVPPAAPSGKGHFEAGLYDYRAWYQTGVIKQLDILDANDRPAGNTVNLGAVMVGSPAPTTDLSGLTPAGIHFEDQIELAAWRASTRGNELRLEFGWRALDRPLADYTVFVHLLDSAGSIVAQQDVPPGGTSNPTSLWAPGEVVLTDIALPGGGVKLRVGLYEPVSGRRLAITSPAGLGSADRSVTLALHAGS